MSVPVSEYRSSGGHPALHVFRGSNWPCETDLMLTMTISWTEEDSKDTHRRYFGKLWANGLPVDIPVETSSGRETLTTYITTTTTTGTVPVYGGVVYNVGYREFSSWKWGEGTINFVEGPDGHATDVSGQGDEWCSSGAMRFRHLKLEPGTYSPTNTVAQPTGSFFSFGLWGIQERVPNFPDYFTALSVNGSTANETAVFRDCGNFTGSLPDPGTFTTNATAISNAHTNSITIDDGATVSWTAANASASGWQT